MNCSLISKIPYTRNYIILYSNNSYYLDEEKSTDMAESKLHKAMNQLDSISEKSVTKDDNTEIEDENIMEYFVILNRGANSQSGDKS